MTAVRQRALPDQAATEALAEALAEARPERAVLYLRGDLGVGKSTLARAMLRALGVTGAIRSPTYTLVERYPLPDGGEAAHLDLYRIVEAGELEFLALDELTETATLWLIEWPERGGRALPAPDATVELSLDEPGRRAALFGHGPVGEAWLATAVGNACGNS